MQVKVVFDPYFVDLNEKLVSGQRAEPTNPRSILLTRDLLFLASYGLSYRFYWQQCQGCVTKKCANESSSKCHPHKRHPRNFHQNCQYPPKLTHYWPNQQGLTPLYDTSPKAPGFSFQGTFPIYSYLYLTQESPTRCNYIMRYQKQGQSSESRP